jgi:hypothetical protein
MRIEMQHMTTVVVVHATTAPTRPLLVALCDEHTALLHRAARIDELVGFSTTMDCEACALIDPGISAAADAISQLRDGHQYLHPLPTTA